MVENDAEAIGRFMADDWTIVGSDGKVGDKTTFLALVKSGALSHDVLTSEDMNVRVYGDTAVVNHLLTRTTQERSFVFRVTDVCVRRGGRWQLVNRHITEVPPPR